MPRPPFCQPNIQYSKIRFVTLTQFDCLLDGAGDAAHFVAARCKSLFQHVGHDEIVFRNHDTWHIGYPFAESAGQAKRVCRPSCGTGGVATTAGALPLIGALNGAVSGSRLAQPEFEKKSRYP